MSESVSIVVISAFSIGLLTAATGGYWLGRGRLRAANVAQQESDPFAGALASLAEASRRCEKLIEAVGLTERQIHELTERQLSLASTLRKLSKPNPGSEESGDGPPPVWVFEPKDPVAELPAQAAFELNVTALTKASTGCAVGGLLLISIDRFDALQGRIGRDAAQALVRTVAGLLCRSGRDQDVICVLEPGLFSILMPDRDPEILEQQSVRVRDAFAAHPFRNGVNGEELLVTASFGYTPCLADDQPALLIDRARTALASSRRRGRNQLNGYRPQGQRVEAL